LLLGNPRSLVHSNFHCLSVTFSFTVKLLFHVVSQCMSVIQTHPFPGVILFLLHSLSFDIHTSAYHSRKLLSKPFKRPCLFQYIEESSVFYAAVLDDFPHPIVDITFRKCRKDVWIDENELRLIESPYEVFSFFQINRHLPSDG